MPDASDGTCMGFDYGTKRIGIAIGNYHIETANPIGVVNNVNGTPDWESIERYIDLWRPEMLIVGWPLTEQGQEQPITSHVKGFIKRLKKRYLLPTHPCDERYTSIMAQQTNQQLRNRRQRGRKTQREDIDKLSAALILETWYSLRSQA